MAKRNDGMATSKATAPKVTAAAARKPRAKAGAKPVAAKSNANANNGASLRDQAADLTQQAKDKVRDAASSGKDKATDAMGGLSNMVDDVAATLDDKFGAQYGDYARRAASAVSGLADTIKSKEVEELVEDARDFVRKRPAVAIGAAAALGFVLTRLLKAGTDDDD
jgi:ElaB/YqjD/DUF883 family membrane-anchored ribosome-binding protein